MMNEHTQLAERLRMANPVPDPAQPPVGAVGADVVLLQIERRSTTVQTTEAETRDEAATRRRWSGVRYAVAAFAAVVVVIVGLIALAGLNDADEPVATTTTGATSTTTQATTTTLSAAEIGDRLMAEMGIDGSIEPLDTGPVAFDSLATPLTAVIPDRSADYEEPPWRVDDPTGITIWSLVPMDPLGQERDEASGSLFFIDLRSGDDYDEVVADVIDEVPVNERIDTTVGGVPAVQIEVASLGSVGGVSGEVPLTSLGTVPIPGEEGESPGYWLSGPEIRDRFYIIDAPTGTLIVVFAIDPAEWDTLAPYWEQILASIEFTR